MVAVAAAVLVTAPSASFAAPRPPLTPEVEALLAEAPERSNAMYAQIVTRPHKGYRWSVVAYKESPSAHTTLRMTFVRSAAQGTQHQTSEFHWMLSPRALRMDANLKPASLVTRKGMGSNGSIAMKLSEAGRYQRFRAGEGCTGSISFRIARFEGRFRFHARDQYFKRIDLSGARVFLYRAHDYGCRDEVPSPRACPHPLQLVSSDPETGVTVVAVKSEEGKVDQGIRVTGKSGDADAAHTIVVSIAVPEAFEASDDGSTASVDGDAAGPWLSGDLSFLGAMTVDNSVEDCGTYRTHGGVVTGDYSAHFDSIGTVTPASTGMPASLERRI